MIALSRMFDRRIEQAVENAVKEVFDSPKIQAKLGEIVADVVANHKGLQFIKAMQLEMLRVDPKLDVRMAWNAARDALATFLEDEKVEFGDDRYDWSASAAIDLIHDIEIYHWETKP